MMRFLIMAFTIASSVGTSMSAATGRPTQGHIQYAVTQGAWWVFYLTSTQGLSALYSVNAGSTWAAPSGSPFTLAEPHASEGRGFGFYYTNLSSTDIIHMVSGYASQSGTVNGIYHSRFTLGTTWTRSNAEAADTTLATNGNPPQGCVTILDSSAFPVDLANGWVNSSSIEADIGSNADSGSSWTAGFGTVHNLFNATNQASACYLASLGSRNLLALAASGSGTQTHTNISSYKYSSSAWGSLVSAFTAFTAVDDNAWGATALSITNIVAIALTDASSTYVARTYSGTAWANLGASPSTLAYGTNSGIACVNDGTNIWAFVIDTSKNIQYNKWNGTAWGGWTVLEATRTNTPSYITACYSAAQSAIMVAWTELNGTNHDIIGSVLSLAAAPTYFPQIPFPGIPAPLLTI